MTVEIRDHCRTDTLVHPTMKVYSAGNFGEIAPKRLSPMSWSLVGHPMERGTRTFVRSIIGDQRWASGSHYVFTGYINCRPYHNLTAYCRIAHHVDLLTPEDVTAAYFEGIDPPARVTAHRPSRISRNIASTRMLREMANLRPRVIELEQQIFEFEQDLASVGEGGSDWRIGELVLRSEKLLDRAWHLHIVGTSGSIAAEVLQRSVVGRLARGGNAVANWLKEPAELPWSRIAGLATLPGGPSGFVRRPFYELADTMSPWSDYVIPQMDSAHLIAQNVDTEVSPREALMGMSDPFTGRAIDATTLMLGDIMALREHSKSLAMRLLHATRSIVATLARLRGVADQDWPYCTFTELRGELPSAAEFNDRRQSCEDALAVDMPDYLDLNPGAPEMFQPTRSARGVSAGSFVGVAIGLGDDIQEGSVLVCESADANVIPVLPFVGAVVTARGSQYSHIAIICRELGIPAVVSHPIANEIKPGQRVYVNGDNGKVSIIESQ